MVDVARKEQDIVYNVFAYYYVWFFMGWDSPVRPR